MRSSRRAILGVLVTLGLLTAGGLFGQSAQATNGQVTGTVVTLDGPVSAGSVSFYATCQDYDDYRLTSQADISGGSYTATKIPNGTYRVQISPGSDGAFSWHNAKSTCEQADTVIVSGNSTVNLVATGGSSVSGSVTSSNGPVASGEVEFFATCQDYDNYTPATRVPFNGANYSATLPDGSYRVRVQPDDLTGAAESWHSAKASCEQADTVTVNGTTTANLIATAGYAVSGTVSSSNGPVTSGVVYFYSVCGDNPVGRGSISSGTYSATNIPEGSYRVSVTSYERTDGAAEESWHDAKSSCAQADTVTVNGATTANLVATAGYTVSGTVSSSNGPFTSGDVYFFATCEDFKADDWTGFGHVSSGTYSATDVPNGTYRILILSDWEDEAWSWHNAKPACAQADTVTVNGPTTANLVGAAGFAVSGTVTSSGGPVSGGRLRFYSNCEDYNARRFYAEVETRISNGNYSLNLLPGVYRVLIEPDDDDDAAESWHNAKTSCEQADTVTVNGATTANLVATAGYTVGGTVTSSNGPVTSGYVEFYATCQDYKTLDRVGDEADISSGTYSATGVPNGTYRARINSYAANDGAARSSWNSAKTSCEQADLITVNGATTANLVASAGFRVTGSVTTGTGPEPNPLPSTQPPSPAPPVTPAPPPTSQASAQSATKPSVKLKKGKSTKLARKTKQGSSLAWRSTTKKVCTVKKFKVKALKKGACKLKATAPALAGFAAYNLTVTIKVK